MQLSNSKTVPNGMSFDLDTGPSPLAYVLSTPGNAAVVGLVGDGSWMVDILASYDGQNYEVVDTVRTPGQRRYETKGVAAIAIRVASYASGSGILTGLLAHGGLVPATNVSPVFGSFLTFSYNSTPVEPPTGNQIRFDSGNFILARKAWIANTTVDGVDQYFAVRHAPYGGTLLLQNKTDHLGAVLFGILAPPIDKGAYVEVPIEYQQGITSLNSQQVIIAVFNPGAKMSFAPAARNAYLSPDVLPVPLSAALPPDAPTLTALVPAAAALGTPNFTLHVQGEGFQPTDVILWNGSPEPTTYVSPTELTTGVNMATAQVAMPIPIEVTTAEALLSNRLTFELTAAPEATDPEAEAEDDVEAALDAEEDPEVEPTKKRAAPKKRKAPPRG